MYTPGLIYFQKKLYYGYMHIYFQLSATFRGLEKSRAVRISGRSVRKSESWRRFRFTAAYKGYFEAVTNKVRLIFVILRDG